MKLKNVTVKNFLSVGPETVIPLSLPGLVLIEGSNLDAPKAKSNGAGKSLILSSISWCLWGNTIDSIAADDVVNNTVGEECKVTLTLEDESDTYVITRTRKCTSQAKPNDLLLFKNGLSLTGSNNDITQEKIDKITGLDLELFKALMCGSDTTVASMTDKEIKLLLEKILKTEEMAAAYVLVSDKYKSALKELEVEKSLLSSKTQSLAASEARISQYKHNSNNFEQARELEVYGLLKEQDELASAIDDLKKLTVNTYGLQDCLEEESMAKEALQASQTELAKEVKNKVTLESNFSKLYYPVETEIELIRKQQESISGLVECPTCLSSISEEHKDSVQCSSQEKISKLEQKANKLVKLKTNKLLEIDNKISYLQSKITTYKTTLDAVQAEIKTAQKRMDKAADARVRIEEKRKEIKKLDQKTRALQSKKNDFSKLIEEETSSFLIIEEEVKSLTSKVNTLQEEIPYLKFWVDSFSPSGIRSYMIENVIPFLNERADAYTSLLTEGEMSVKFNTKTIQKTGKEVEKFTIEVSQKHGSKKFKGSSKGERQRANLVVSLVLGDLAALRSSKRLSFRMFDEIFDGIDDVGCESVVGLLNTCSVKYESIYVVTHSKDLKKLFRKGIVIQKKDGFSTVLEIEA